METAVPLENTLCDRLAAAAQTTLSMEAFPAPIQIQARVRDLVDGAEGIGIPNFQRGLVWDSAQKAALLESLFRGTPCGAIMLWRPLTAGVEGEGRHGGPAPEFLVLDGQQRLSTLVEVLGAPSYHQAGEPHVDWAHPEDEARVDEHLWWVRLDALQSASGEPCFRFASERAKGLDDWRPLRPLLRGTGGDLSMALAAIFDRIIAVDVLIESPNRYRLRDVVALYNRINQAGVRVSEEELAWARIAALSGQRSAAQDIDQRWPSEWLKFMFTEVHPEQAARRSDVLKRERERNFGFKLFVQVASLSYAYHAGEAKPVPTAIARANAAAWDGHVRSGGVVIALESASNAVRAVAAALVGPLRCDDLRFLPDASHLWPAFLAVIRFPALARREGVELLAEIVLRSFLGHSDEERGPWDVVSEASSSGEAVEGLRRGCPVTTDGLVKRLEGSLSLNDRYVLMLYWMLRARSASDFRYTLDREIVRSELRKLGHEAPEAPQLQRRFRPEKQHLVPAARLGTSAASAGGVASYRSRVRAHVGNGIANVTYISEAQNRAGGLKVATGTGGLMDEPVDLSIEPPGNLAAHILAGVPDGPGSFKQHAEAPSDAWFTQYVQQRRAEIAEAFVDFTDRVTAGASRALADNPGLQIAPANRLLRWQVLELRRLPLSMTAQDALAKVLDNPGVRRKNVVWKDALLACRLGRLHADYLVTLAAYDIGLNHRPAFVQLSFRDAALRLSAGDALPVGLEAGHWNGDTWWAALDCDAGEQAVLDATTWLAGALG